MISQEVKGTSERQLRPEPPCQSPNPDANYSFGFRLTIHLNEIQQITTL